MVMGALSLAGMPRRWRRPVNVSRTGPCRRHNSRLSATLSDRPPQHCRCHPGTGHCTVEASARAQKVARGLWSTSPSYHRQATRTSLLSTTRMLGHAMLNATHRCGEQRSAKIGGNDRRGQKGLGRRQDAIVRQAYPGSRTMASARVSDNMILGVDI